MDIGKDLQRAYDDGYEQGKRDAMEWTPVTERWPEQFKPVLVYYNRNGYSGMGVAEYYHDGDTKVWRGFGGFIPTHWMPLPEPPEDGET